MKAWILAVGDEVLSGRVVNTNASYLSLKLEMLGIMTEKSIVVGDDSIQISKVISEFIGSDVEVLITTGGLGPTHDDFTKECISQTLNLEMIPFNEAIEVLDNYFDSNYNKCNLKQAYFPKGAKLIPNHLGTADGCIITVENKTIIELVGPSYEMQPMFEETCIPYLLSLTKKRILVKEYNVMGCGESEIEPIIMDIKKRNPFVKINPYCGVGKIRYQITASDSLEDCFNKANDDFKKTMDKYIVSDENKSIEEVLISELKQLGYTISCAESCTGGLLVSKLINVSGASSVIKESLVTYSVSSKEKYLHVNHETVEKYDVASLEVAREMVEGLFTLTHSDVCISVTGVAGPTTDNPAKPVGLVYYGIRIKGKTVVEEQKFKGDRDLIRNRAVMWILYRTLKLLK